MTDKELLSVAVPQFAAYGCAVAMWFMAMLQVVEWTNWIAGLLFAVALAQGIFVYPLIYWFVDGAWPTTYLYVYGALVVCVAIRFVATLVAMANSPY